MEKELSALKDKCKKSIEHFKGELGKMRTGRASSSLLEGIMVSSYGSQVPLKQLGLINVPEARLITIQVYDVNTIESIEKAIQQADLGLNPARDGNFIRISIPALTEERRKELVKALHDVAEQMRVTLRNYRRECIDLFKNKQKEKEISEDDLRRSQGEVQKITDRYIGEVDTLLAAKEKEMLEV